MKTLIVSFILFLLCQGGILANGIGIVDGVSGVFLSLEESSTVVEVRDQIAITKTTQVLRNYTGSGVRIKYGYPLNENANAIKLRWFFKDEWNEATISSLPQDNEIPGDMGGNADMLDQDLQNFLGESPLLFSPKDIIPSEGSIIMEVTYVELLPYFQGKVTYTRKNDLAELLGGPVDRQSFSFTLESERDILDIELFGLEFELESNGKIANLNYTSENQIADFDFVLDYELSSESIGVNHLSTKIADSLFNCDENGNGYFTMIIEPESNVDTEVIQKNFTLIIDKSGSMSGDKMQQAKDAASFIVENLNFGDYFNIIDFSTEISSFSDGLVEYSIQNAAEALEYIENIRSAGFTNISESLITSIDQFNVVEDDKANIILFFTDGNPTIGETSPSGILSLVQETVTNTEQKVFLFTIGVGDDLDPSLLTALATQNNGLVQFIEPATLEEDMVRFFLNINNPVLLNTEITFSPDVIEELYPSPLPNLYKGQQLILSGRYEETGIVDVNIRGEAFNVPVSYDFQITLSDTSNAKMSFLPKIWAKQRLDALTLEYLLSEEPSQRDMISNMIDSLSVCYGIVAVEFSSFNDTTTELEELEESDFSRKFEYFPNPFVDEINIKFPEYQGEYLLCQVKILDTSARELFNQELVISDGILKIKDLDHLQEGIYFVIVNLGSETFALKIIKN